VLDDFALISRADAKAYIGIEDTDRDDAIDDLINQASEWIIGAAEQEFAPSIDDETRRLEYRGDGVISAAPYSLRAVTAVVLDPADAAEAHTTYQLRSAPKGRRAGVYNRIVLAGRYAPLGGVQGVGYVDVTGDWGWPSVPREIERCCTRLVEMWFNAELAFASDGYDGEPIRVPMGVPLDVQDLVHSYKLTRAGAA
jgi:hypothetical protein